MKKADVLVIGQGLAGTWLSWWLFRNQISFHVIDQHNPDSASRRAAGLINPVTGRRLVTTWMSEELMPFASSAYGTLGDFLQDEFISETSVIEFFPTVQMLQAFQKRFDEDAIYLVSGEDREAYADWFRYDLGWGAIKPCYLVKVEKLLSAWRAWLKKNELLTESAFDRSAVAETAAGVHYADIDARYIVYCDGKSSATDPYFNRLPFALNKGEGLLVEIKGLPENLVFKKGMSLIPFNKNIFWLGSSYEWTFTDNQPSEKFRMQAESWLKHVLKIPFTVLEHFAALRPATLERRPFVGFHPAHPNIGILNGLGTKGCSLAPYFAKQLADQIAGQGTIDPLADIRRFEKILLRS